MEITFTTTEAAHRRLRITANLAGLDPRTLLCLSLDYMLSIINCEKLPPGKAATISKARARVAKIKGYDRTPPRAPIGKRRYRSNSYLWSGPATPDNPNRDHMPPPRKKLDKPPEL